MQVPNIVGLSQHYSPRMLLDKVHSKASQDFAGIFMLLFPCYVNSRSKWDCLELGLASRACRCAVTLTQASSAIMLEESNLQPSFLIASSTSARHQISALRPIEGKIVAVVRFTK